jgi:hypothetical protein
MIDDGYLAFFSCLVVLGLGMRLCIFTYVGVSFDDFSSMSLCNHLSIALCAAT